MFYRKEDCHNIESVNVNLFIYSTKNEESISVKEKISSLIKCEQFNVLFTIAYYSDIVFFVHSNNGIVFILN